MDTVCASFQLAYQVIGSPTHDLEVDHLQRVVPKNTDCSRPPSIRTVEVIKLDTYMGIGMVLISPVFKQVLIGLDRNRGDLTISRNEVDKHEDE